MMKWGLKFVATKGKRDGGGGLSAGTANAGAAKSVGIDTTTLNSNSRGELRSSGDEDSEGRAVGEEEDAPIETPPDNANGDNGITVARGNGVRGRAEGNLEDGDKEEADRFLDNNGGAEAAEGNDSAPPFTVANGGQEGEGEDWERDVDDDSRSGGADGRGGAGDGDGGGHQDDVFDDDSQRDGEDADSVVVSKTARNNSFADDPEGHALGDADADDWEGECPLCLVCKGSCRRLFLPVDTVWKRCNKAKA